MANDLFAFVGTYTRLGSEGIYTLKMNGNTGELEQVSLATGIENPSFLALDPSNEHLYAVCEVGDKDGGGACAAFSINQATGELTPINQQSTGGPGPCHLMVDGSDSLVIATNYAGGSVAVLPINDDGSLGERTEFIQHEGSSINPQRQEKAHAHSVNIDESNTHAYVCDLGMDKVFIYDIDHENGKLNPSQQPSVDEVPGQGPRHFTFHPSGKFVYVLNELGCTITAYHLSANGGLKPIETVGTLPDDWEGDNTTADIHTSPDGNYVYASNRGHHSLVIYEVDSSSGRLTYVGHEQTRGETPRNFAITPDGRFVLAENQDTGTVVTFNRNADGTLEATGSVIDVPAPVCIQFMPVGG